MNAKYAIAIGAFIAGAAATGVISAIEIQKVYKDVDAITSGMNYIRKNIDIKVDPDVASELIKSASNDVAFEAVNKAAESTKKMIHNEIDAKVRAAIKDAYDDVADKVAEQLQSQINLQTLDRIEDKVAKEVTKHIVRSYSNGIFPTTSNKADVAKACIDKGMDGYSVARVMQAMQ